MLIPFFQIQTTTVRSPSDDEFDSGEDDAPSASGISRSRLRIDAARSRFMPASVDARDVDFSDRVSGKRRSYRAATGRRHPHRVLRDGTEELGDLSDEDGAEAEDLARKIARLRREVEEAKEEYGKQKAAGAANTDQEESEITLLSQALDEIPRAPAGIASGAPARGPRLTEPSTTESGPAPSHDGSATYTVTYEPTYEQTHALAKAADFDRRLVLLEKSLGIGSSAVPELDPNGLPRAVLPTLETLQKQISTLSEASTASLDSISRRVRTLAQEADQLEKSRRSAKAAQDALASATSGTADGAAPAQASPADAEQAAKINALYGTLPTIESLAPLLPPLLDRLRSLRALHADAAGAAEALVRLERRQADVAGEIAQWRDGLEKIEAAMREGEGAMAGNTKVVEGWVRELETRVAKLG